MRISDWSSDVCSSDLLDEDNAEDGEPTGPDAECSPQTVIHRLNALSKLLQTWARAHKVPLENPVKPGVRPGRPEGRDRRLADKEGRRSGRASCREGVGQEVLRSVVAVS